MTDTGKHRIPPSPELNADQARDITRLAGSDAPVVLTHLKRANDVWRLQQGDQCYFLKVFTKDWYSAGLAQEAGCVRHEHAAYMILAAHGLQAPVVQLARPDLDNPLGRPFILLRELAGISLVSLLRQCEDAVFGTLLEATGAYLRRVHAITFRYPGYLMDLAGPPTPPAGGQWQHPIWTAQAAQMAALAMLEADSPRLSAGLIDRLAGVFSTLSATLAPAYDPPRFTHGDCHADQFFLAKREGIWQVTGFVDMEVASAGASEADFAKLCLELMCQFPPQTHWWIPLFAGYGHEPDFERLRLWLLSMGEPSFKAYGAEKWPATWEATVAHLLAARDWQSLFTRP